MSNTTKPIGEQLEELWDKYSEMIGDNLFDMERVAGSCVITKRSFDKLCAELLQPSSPPPTLQEQADLRTKAVNYVTELHKKESGDLWYEYDEAVANAWIAGHAQASGSLREQLDNCKSMWEAEAERRVELEGKLKVAEEGFLWISSGGPGAVQDANKYLKQLQATQDEEPDIYDAVAQYRKDHSNDTEGSKGGGC